ncbi:Uncharacterised protein [Salmonella enterica subsp. enterica serovar Typhi]|nr:Uncharacterised protein [Salmonella enterica subsp. enterica serovar Typhi]
MRLADDGRQVGANKGFTDRGADACEHEYIILRLHHGEMEAGAQAANRLNRQIGRIAHRQQLALLVTLNPFNGFDAIARFLPFRQRNTGIDADPVLLQRLRAFDTAIKQRAQQHADNR